MNILVYRCFQKKKYLPKNFIKECAQMKRKEGRVIFEMKDVNRQVVMLVLDKIEKDGTEEFLTCLEA